MSRGMHALPEKRRGKKMDNDIMSLKPLNFDVHLELLVLKKKMVLQYTTFVGVFASIAYTYY